MKKRTEDRVIDVVFNILCLSISIFCFIRGIFKADVRIGTVSRKFQIEQHSFEETSFPWGRIYSSVTFKINMVIIVDDYGKEVEYRVDNDDIYESILVDQCIRFKCLRGRIIEVFADTSETQADDLCTNAQAA